MAQKSEAYTRNNIKMDTGEIDCEDLYTKLEK
jgi:hypothetical protein